jgi:hypothetical protein
MFGVGALEGLMQRVRFEIWTPELDAVVVDTLSTNLLMDAQERLDSESEFADRARHLSEGFDALLAHQEQLDERWTELLAREQAIREREHAVVRYMQSIDENMAFRAAQLPPPPPPPSQPRRAAQQFVGGWPTSDPIRWLVVSGRDQWRSRAAREERIRAAQEQRAAREAMEEATPR